MSPCFDIQRLDCNFDYESFTKACFPADMNRVRGALPGVWVPARKQSWDQITMSRYRACQA
jgi:hypothetical protein